MPPNDFDDFVKRQQATDELNQFWGNEKDEYIKDLEELYDSIAGYLEPYIKSGTIYIDRYKRSIVEENTGSYDAPGLIVKIGRQTVKFDPQGTQIIGAKGRVDVSGSKGRARIVRVDAKHDTLKINVMVSINNRTVDNKGDTPSNEPIEWAWKIVSAPPKIKFIEINKENLMDMLMAVSNG